MNRLAQWIRTYGQFIGKDHCELFSKALTSLPERLASSSRLSVQLAKFLQASPLVTQVDYVFDSKYIKYSLSPSCFRFHVRTELSKTKLVKMLALAKYFPFETSYGAAYSKIDTWPVMQSVNQVKGVWLRLAVGYDDNIDSVQTNILGLLNDLASA
jgi:cystathionine beta-lyase/cystathionine gamma-synthase